MKVIVASNLGGGIIPVGSLLFWNGTAGSLPTGWQLFDSAADAFIMGTNTAGINLTVQGSAEHQHIIGDTGDGGAHTHADLNFTTGENTEVQKLTNGDNYNVIVKHTHSGTATFESANNHVHSISNTNLVSNLPTYIRYYLMKSISATDIPVGAIALWSGRLIDIPSGWRICDGSTSGGITVPDIRGRFIYIPNNDTAKGTTGGANSHSHNSPTSTLNHDHYHKVTISQLTNTTVSGAVESDIGTTVSTSKAEHTHPQYDIYSSTFSHNHTLPSITAKEILPPYIKLYYIMKVQ